MTDVNEGLLGDPVVALSAKRLQVDGELLDVPTPPLWNGFTMPSGRHGPIDVLVDNAGIAISNHPAETMTDAVWAKLIDVNLNGVSYCCRSFGSGMLKRSAGALFNVGSMSGFVINRPQEQANYNASKAAVHHLTRSLAVEWAARGVRERRRGHLYRNGIDPVRPRGRGHVSPLICGTPMGRMGRTN